MFKNYILTTLRNLWKHKFLSFVYFFGLAISIAAFTLIMMWVKFQFSFDRSLNNANNTYRVYPHIMVNGNNFTSSMAPPPLRGLLKDQFAELQAVTRMYKYITAAVKKEESGQAVNSFNEELYQADSNFFKVFDYKILQGNADKALTEPYSIVITKSTAIKYFGQKAFESNSILGKTMDINMNGWKMNPKITGITEDLPANTHFHYSIILSDASDSWDASKVWVDNTYYTYVVLKKGTDPKQFESKIAAAVKPYIDPQLQSNFSTTFEKLKANGGYWEYKLQPLTSIHLHSNLERELEPGTSIDNIYILLVAGILLLLMACINYANISTVRSIRRSKEIGLRKTLGSSKWKLTLLVFTETGMVSLIAILIAIVFIAAMFHPFQNLMQTTLPASAFTDKSVWLWLCGIFVAITLLAGMYPAFYLSSFNVIEATKGKAIPGKGFSLFKKSLILAQFFMFIGLVACTILVKQQLIFLRSKSPGFNKDNVVILKDAGVKISGNNIAFLTELQKVPGVTSANVCADFPNSDNDNFPIAASYRKGEADHMIANFKTGYDFLKTFDVQLLKGRDFNRQLDQDTLKRIILNEAAVKELGISDPINAIINTKYLNSLDIKTVQYQVIGVVRDFNFKSLHKNIQPMAIFLNTWGQYIAIKITSGNVGNTISGIKQVWEKFVPDSPFDYQFLDNRVDRLYKTESVLSNVLNLLTALIIIIAVMGLAGLTLLTIQQRTGEIGIRKVVGASINDILLLLSKDYIRWVVISFVLAVPVAWFIISKWLQGFAYRTPIAWWVFIVSGLAALIVVIITVSLQSIKAATTNPVKSLRTD